MRKKWSIAKALMVLPMVLGVFGGLGSRTAKAQTEITAWAWDPQLTFVL